MLRSFLIRSSLLRSAQKLQYSAAAALALPLFILGIASEGTFKSARANTTTTGIIRTSPRPGLTTAGMTFKQAMNLGYAASRQGDLHTALINFQRALLIQPGNPYAAAAADNMAYYIQHERYATRQQTIDRLHARLSNAIAQTDWVCAATTLDELTAYTAPNSLDRERLIGQRGEVSGLLDARLNHERWSTVCTAQNPVY